MRRLLQSLRGPKSCLLGFDSRLLLALYDDGSKRVREEV